MKLQTKFNTGDTLHFLQKSKIEKQIVHSIQINVKEEIEIVYWFKVIDGEGISNYHFETRNENECFKSRVELIDSL